MQAKNPLLKQNHLLKKRHKHIPHFVIDQEAGYTGLFLIQLACKELKYAWKFDN